MSMIAASFQSSRGSLGRLDQTRFCREIALKGSKLTFYLCRTRNPLPLTQGVSNISSVSSGERKWKHIHPLWRMLTFTQYFSTSTERFSTQALISSPVIFIMCVWPYDLKQCNNEYLPNWRATSLQ